MQSLKAYCHFRAGHGQSWPETGPREKQAEYRQTVKGTPTRHWARKGAAGVGKKNHSYITDRERGTGEDYSHAQIKGPIKGPDRKQINDPDKIVVKSAVTMGEGRSGCHGCKEQTEA